MNYQTVSRILISGQLYLHSSKLNPPTNLIINWNFKPYWIPVSSIQHLKQRILFIWHVWEILMHNQDVTFHDICHMIDQMIVNLNVQFLSLNLDFLSLFFGYLQVEIVVLGKVELSVPDVIVCAWIAWVRNVSWVSRVEFFLWSVIDWAWNYVPSNIPVSYFTLNKGSSCGQSQEQGTQHIKLIMYVPSMIQIFGRKGTLKTAKPHSKAHRIQINLPIIRLISLPNFFEVSVLINHQRHSDVYCMFFSKSDVFCQSRESRMRSNVIVWYISALGDGINELFLCWFLPDTQKWYARDCHRNSLFWLQNCIFGSDLANNLVQIVSSAVWLGRCHLKHVAAVFEHHREI